MPVQEKEFKFNLNINNDRDWNVVLHNDDNINARVVIEAIMEVIGYDEKKCTNIMYEAHTKGRSIIITTNKIVADFYKERLESYRLTISLEQNGKY